MNAPPAGAQRSFDVHEILARQGLRLPAATLKQLRAAGIYCSPRFRLSTSIWPGSMFFGALNLEAPLPVWART